MVLVGITQGIGLEVNPYGITSMNRQGHVEGQQTSARWNMGFDASNNITSKLRAAVTVNTDFVETAVDQRQVNLDRETTMAALPSGPERNKYQCKLGPQSDNPS